MVKDFDTQKKEKYMMVKRKVRTDCEELLCSNDPKISQHPIDIGEYFIEDLLTYIYQALKGPPHERFKDKLANSWSEFDLNIESLAGLNLRSGELAEEKDLLNHLSNFNVLWGDPDLYET